MLRRAITVSVGILGLVAVFIATVYVCGRLRSTFGPLPVVLVGLFFGAAWLADVWAAGIAADAKAVVFGDLRLSTKLLEEMGWDKGGASRQLNGVERFDYGRWSRIDGFEAAFAVRRAKRLGGFVVIPDGLVAQAMERLTRIVAGAA